jgi:hypothetical protein
VDCVAAGGSAAIIDVENGADEYARRLEDILVARDGGGTESALAEACAERLRYYDWPSLSRSWMEPDWVAALDGVDLVAFDSSRMVLTSVGFAEDSADDYSAFMSKFIVPLSKAGIATLVLDNTGHEERNRARGTITKADLNEVAYTIKPGKAFDRERGGFVKLDRTRSRFPELPKHLFVPLGGTSYGPVTTTLPTGDAIPAELMEALSLQIEARPTGINQGKLFEITRGRKETQRWAIRCLEEGGYISVDTGRPDVKTDPIIYSSLKPYRAPAEDGK